MPSPVGKGEPPMRNEACDKGFIIKSKRSLSGASGRVVSRVLSTTTICLGVCVAAQLHATSEIPLRGGRAALLSHGVASDRVYICTMLPSMPVSSYLAFPPLLREPQITLARNLRTPSAHFEYNSDALEAVYLCCTFPEVTLGGRYPLSCPVMPGLSSR